MAHHTDPPRDSSRLGMAGVGGACARRVRLARNFKVVSSWNSPATIETLVGVSYAQSTGACSSANGTTAIGSPSARSNADPGHGALP